MKEVTIVGGAGYLGSKITLDALRNNYKVKILDTFWYWKDIENFKENIKTIIGNKIKNMESISIDIREKNDLKKELNKTKNVIFLSALSYDSSIKLNPNLMYSINYTGTIDTIDIAIETKVKNFIFLSSVSVYGLTNKTNITEEEIVYPTSLYGLLKLEIEHYLKHKTSWNFRTTILRSATIFGWSPRYRLDTPINYFIHEGFNNKKIIYTNNNMRAYVNINNISKATLFALENLTNEKINKNIFNIVDFNIKTKDLVYRIKNIIEKYNNTKIEIKYIPKKDPRNYNLSSKKYKSIFPKNKNNLKQEIKNILSKYKNNEIDINNINLYNVKKLKKMFF